ncbi:MAG: formylmethanofuran dehydrogenase subunit B [Anaerolineae bacterium]|jgi:formylmethanofuran dehydrogenase subunit B|nr:formylmethanofuran dehydrogenase subunit B [Anaerolineae bacterium]
MIVGNVVCPFCGCLCDDIVVTVEDNRITAVEKACTSGRSLFLNVHTQTAKPTVDGKEVEWAEAVDVAARILTDAANPLIYGLSSTASEAQRKAIALADLLGATIDSTSSVCHGPTTIGIQVEGEPTCTLGEIKHRADLLVFWGCNPAESHQRHFARYSVLAKGKLTPGGRRDRTMVVVDVRPTLSTRRADVFLQVRPGHDFELLNALRALLKGQDLDVDQVGGVEVARLQDLVERMKSCRFGVIFFGMGVTQTGGKHLNVAELVALVAELNAYTRFTAMPMRGHGNVAGADCTLTWQTGYPFAVNFARGYPQYNPGEFTAVDVLARGETDAALIIASDPVAHFPRRAAQRLAQIPTIVLDPEMSLTAQVARVVLPTAFYGVNAAGTAYRMDNVPLPLKKVVDSSQPTDEQVLDWIIEKVKTCSA